MTREDDQQAAPTGRPDPGHASRGALGGARNEQGSELRARVGALLATTIISQAPLASVGCPVPFVGLTISAERRVPGVSP
jgi:hypothetical protein